LTPWRNSIVAAVCLNVWKATQPTPARRAAGFKTRLARFEASSDDPVVVANTGSSAVRRVWFRRPDRARAIDFESGTSRRPYLDFGGPSLPL
jgi:hypothetical protein